MSEEQMRLFPASRPLAERMGGAFFRSVPAQAGVYFFYDGQGRVLYIGQSGNLKERLCSYRYVHPDKHSRRLVRLVHEVEKIQWETCPSASAARLRESELLRTQRPCYNRRNVYPRACLYVEIRTNGGELECALTREPGVGAEVYGAFKPGCIAAFGSLARLSFVRRRDPEGLGDFPYGLLGEKPRRQFLVAGDPREAAQFFDGESAELIDQLAEAVWGIRARDAVADALLGEDLEVVRRFYERGPVRNAELRERFAIAGRLIEPEQLYDLEALGF